MTLKKALVAITVVAMLFGMVGTAFAGGFSDITDTKVAAAAGRLNALSIMQGFPDGSFGATATITRAQFAAVSVRALGLDSAATYAKGFTKFSDVGADHWASGYVNIAAQQGIIAGFPDGTFHPEEPVTYAQALTIIVRMLGYGPVTEGKGTWPSNYIVRAAMVGFTSGVSFAAMEPASRGNVALFVDNSLTADLMVNTGAVGTADTYEIKAGVNLLNTYLGATEVEGQLTSSPDLLGVSTIAVDGGDALALADGVSVAGLLGRDVSVWTKGGKVVLVEDASANVVSGGITAYTAGTSIKIGTTTYTIAAVGPFLAKNGVKPGIAPVAGDEAQIVLNSDAEVVAIIAYDYTIATVDEIDVDGKLVYTDVDTLDFGAGTSSLTLNGKAAAFSDLKAGDIVQYYADGSDNKVVVATRTQKTGTVSRVNADGTVVIGGATYTILGYAAVADATTLAGEDVEFSLDKNGDIATIATVAAAAATEVYAAVTTDSWAVPTADGTGYYFKALRADGTKVTLKFAATVSVDGAPAAAPIANLFGGVGDFISYTLNSDGAVATVDVLLDSPATFVGTDTAQDATNKLADSLLVTAGTIIVDLSDPTAPAFITSSAFFGLDVSEGTVVADAVVTRRADYIVVLAYTGVADAPYAYVTDVYFDGDWKVETAAGDTYTTSVLDPATAIEVGTVYTLTLSGDDITAAVYQSDVNAGVAGWDHNVVISYDSTEKILTYKTVDANSVKIDTEYALFNSGTVFVDATGSTAKAGTSALLTAGKTVELYDFDIDGIVDMVVVK